MLSGRKVSIEHIINNLYRDNDYADHVNKSDMVEWAGEAMDLIGIPMHLETKIATENRYDSTEDPYITISDYKGFLPCDLVSIVQVRDYDTKEVLRYSSDTFHTNSHHNETSTYTSYEDKTYKINNTCIYTNYKSGKLEVLYKGYYTDMNGYPLIPEETRYSMAVKAYLQYKADYKLFRKNKLSGEIYQLSEQDWLFRVGSAGTFAHTPSVDQMESWKNQMVRLVPHINEHAVSFRGVSMQEQKRN